MNKELLFKEILEQIKENDNIVILRHERPDGDCIGSSFGLREILKQSFPQKNIYSYGDKLPNYLKFLGEEDEVSDEVFNNSLIIVVDTSNIERIACDKKINYEKVIKIDHHIVVDNYGYINLVCENIAACSQIIYEFYNACKDELVMSLKASECLYTGIVTDTGRFKYKDVNKDTMYIAGDILENGINTEYIYSNLNTKSLASFQLQGYVYQNCKLTKNGVCYIHITKRIMKKYKASLDDASNLVNAMDSIKGSMIWILFIDYPEEVRIRFRSRYIPVVDIASLFNGGGHENAAGGKILKAKEIKKVLNIADEKLRAFKECNKELF